MFDVPPLDSGFPEPGIPLPPSVSGFYSAQISLPEGDPLYSGTSLWLRLYYDTGIKSWLTLDEYGQPTTVSVTDFVLDWRIQRI